MVKAKGKPGTDGKIIRAFMKEQPRSLGDLKTATGASMETLKKRLGVLAKMNVAKETPGGWAFSNYNLLEKTVREAMEQIKGDGFYWQSSVTIANMVNQLNPDLTGATPEEVEPIAWRLSSKLKVTIDENEVFFNKMVAHSRKLISAIRQIARMAVPKHAEKEEEYVDVQEMKIFIDCVMAHFLKYPYILGLIDNRTKLEKNVEMLEKKFHLNLTEKLKNEFKDESVVGLNEGRKLRSFIGVNIPSLIYVRIRHGNLGQIVLEGEMIWIGGDTIAKGPHLLNRIREFMDRETYDDSNIKAVKIIENAQNSAKLIGPDIEREALKIILRIESDNPLRGRCEICTV